FKGLDASYAGKTVYEVLPSGSVQTLGGAGYTITGTSGTNQTNLDFARSEERHVGGHKYEHGNGDDGEKDDGDDEKARAGVTIFIDKNGNGLKDEGAANQTTTAADGSWSFKGLDASYAGKTVYEVLPSGSVQTLGGAGYTITGTSGTNQTNLDFA